MRSLVAMLVAVSMLLSVSGAPALGACDARVAPEAHALCVRRSMDLLDQALEVAARPKWSGQELLHLASEYEHVFGPGPVADFLRALATARLERSRLSLFRLIEAYTTVGPRALASRRVDGIERTFFDVVRATMSELEADGRLGVHDFEDASEQLFAVSCVSSGASCRSSMELDRALAENSAPVVVALDQVEAMVGSLVRRLVLVSAKESVARSMTSLEKTVAEAERSTGQSAVLVKVISPSEDGEQALRTDQAFVALVRSEAADKTESWTVDRGNGTVYGPFPERAVALKQFQLEAGLVRSDLAEAASALDAALERERSKTGGDASALRWDASALSRLTERALSAAKVSEDARERLTISHLVAQSILCREDFHRCFAALDDFAALTVEAQAAAETVQRGAVLHVFDTLAAANERPEAKRIAEELGKRSALDRIDRGLEASRLDAIAKNQAAYAPKAACATAMRYLQMEPKREVLAEATANVEALCRAAGLDGPVRDTSLMSSVEGLDSQMGLQAKGDMQ